MSALRAQALYARSERIEARAAKERAQARELAEEGVRQAMRSPLGTWFPGIAWHFVGNCSDGTVLVKEQGNSLKTVIGVTATDRGDQGPDEWKVAVYEPFLAGALGSKWKLVETLTEPADLGDYIERTETKPSA